MKKINLILIVSLVFLSCMNFSVVYAGSDGTSKLNPITTGVTFLTIGPDAIAGGKGDVGAASTPDLFSQHWNPAKYAFIKSDMGIGLSYTPWLKKLASDIGLSSLMWYKHLDDVQTVSASLNYFALGQIFLTSESGTDMGNAKPNEFSLDAAYTRLLSDNFSGSVALRIISSNLGVNTDGYSPGFAYASDVAFYYQKELRVSRKNSWITAGINISNIGSKISYDHGETHDFIPTNLRLGVGYKREIDKYNTFGVYFDANKLLVPTPPVKGDGETQADYDQREADYDKTSVLSGIFKSFSDAPGGAKEEFQEISFSGGVEYEYSRQFFLRAGYNYENPNKGNRKYATFGAGFKMNVFSLDFSYLVSTVQNNPLDNTLRFTLSFDFDAFRRRR